MAISVDPEQTAPIGAVCSGSTLFASILNLSVMLGNHSQQTTSADDIFRCIFSWRFKGLFLPILLLSRSFFPILARVLFPKLLEKGLQELTKCLPEKQTGKP